MVDSVSAVTAMFDVCRVNKTTSPTLSREVDKLVCFFKVYKRSLYYMLLRIIQISVRANLLSIVFVLGNAFLLCILRSIYNNNNNILLYNIYNIHYFNYNNTFPMILFIYFYIFFIKTFTLWIEHPETDQAVPRAHSYLTTLIF